MLGEKSFRITLKGRNYALERVFREKANRVFRCVPVRNPLGNYWQVVERRPDRGQRLVKHAIRGVVTAGRAEICRADDGEAAGTNCYMKLRMSYTLSTIFGFCWMISANAFE